MTGDRWEDVLVRDLVAQANRVRTWARILVGFAVMFGLLWLGSR